MSLKLIKALFSLAVFFLLGCSGESMPSENQTIDQANGAQSNNDGFALLDGGLAEIRSDPRLLFINYWASWCLPCLEEMPELEAFRKQYSDAVEVYAVNFDRLAEPQLQTEFTALGVDIPAFVSDPYQALGYERPTVLPTTIIMLEGQVKDVLIGPQTKESLETVLTKWSTEEGEISNGI